MTTELLEQVAKVAPEWMGAECKGPVLAVRFTGVTNSPLIGSASDVSNGAAIIAMLDAMEQDGEKPYILPKNGDAYLCGLQGRTFPKDGWAHGKTRAEAVAKAFVQVFAKDEVNL
jgi:hypothetical protein